MLIIKLRQQILILEKSWMRKHEVNYHEKTNIIEFFSEFCTHSRKIKTKTTSSSNKEKNISSNKEKNIFFEKKSFLNQSNHSKFDDSIRNSKESKKSVTKILFRKEVCSDQSIHQSRLIFLEKTKNRQKRSIELKIRKRLKISDSILMISKSLIRKRNCLKWTFDDKNISVQYDE
jgi:hypothetical protein